MSFKAERHEFALNVPEGSLGDLCETQIILKDSDLVRRITSVLRLYEGESLILFDSMHSTSATILKIGKRDIVCRRGPLVEHQCLSPRIDWIVPMVEKDAYESLAVSLTVLGACSIQPVVTRKTHRRNFMPKERERLQRLMVSAAEQSKQFSIPTIAEPINLEEMLKTLHHESRIFFDADGVGFTQVIHELQRVQPAAMVCMVGPEGDLTLEEKKLMHQSLFTFSKLTPTILRSELAIAVAMGALRSMLS